MGRRQTPAELRLAKGNPGKRPIAAPRVAPVVDASPAGAAPRWLTNKAAREIWGRLHGDLTLSKLLRSTDANAFGRYCQYMAEWIDLNRRLAKLGDPTYETDSAHGKMRRIDPLFTARSRLEDDLVKLEEQMALNPRARQAILMQMAGLVPSLPGLFGVTEQSKPAAPGDEPLPRSPIGYLTGGQRPN